MKRYLMIVTSLLVFACSDDDSNSNQQNPPINNFGKLTKLVSSFPTFNGQSELIVTYDDFERIVTTRATNTSPSGSNTNVNTYLYNDDGHIWKIVSEGNNNLTREYTYLNGLIISAIETGSLNTTRIEYFYNTFDQLENKKVYDENDILIEEVTYTYNAEGNISTKTNEANGIITVYSYEYNTGLDPYYDAFDNFGINEISESSRNNITRTTITSNSQIIMYTSQYTYNNDSLPLTMNEFRDGILYRQSSYTY